MAGRDLIVRQLAKVRCCLRACALLFSHVATFPSQAGADIDWQLTDATSFAPLHSAVHGGFPGTVLALLELVSNTLPFSFAAPSKALVAEKLAGNSFDSNFILAYVTLRSFDRLVDKVGLFWTDNCSNDW